MHHFRRLAAFLFVVPLAAAGCGAPMWHLNPAIANEAARKSNKPLLVYFKTWDSPQHRDMKLKVFENPRIKELLMQTVNLELAYGWFPEEARQYRISSGQVCVMCDPQGQEVARLYLNPLPTEDKFLEWLSAARDQALGLPSPTTSEATSKTPAKAKEP